MNDGPRASVRSAFWPCFWTGVAVTAAKVVQWSLPDLSSARVVEYLTDLTVSSHRDIALVAGVGVLAEVALRASSRRPGLRRWLWRALVALGFVATVYAVASVKVFDYLRAPLTYPLLYLAGDMKNMRSSLGAFVSPGLVAAFVIAPAAYLGLLWVSTRGEPPLPTRRRRTAQAAAAVALAAVLFWASRTADGRWSDRADHLIVLSPHWELLASFATELLGGAGQRFDLPFEKDDLVDFEGPHAIRASRKLPPFLKGRRPKNLILIVLESTGTKYLSLYGSPYQTTPNLEREAGHALVFDGSYCHVGLTANSMFALTLSNFPYMTWREYTQEYPDYPGTALGNLLRARGYRTAFFHSGDLEYVNQRQFLRTRGFDSMQDVRDLSPDHQVSSWGGEDWILFDGLLKWLDQDGTRTHPFFAMGWTQQSHHPYEPTPGQEQVDFFKGRPLPPDDYDLGRYLNTLAEVDRGLGKLFAGLRQRHLADDTLVVLTGDHGEGFGDPHPTWGHGARVFEENVRIPLLIWNPRLFPKGERRPTIGSHVDLNPTIADLMGLAPAASWEGRSLFDPDRPPRAYFYAANDDYLLGVREGKFKYVYNATRGRDELYDLTADPDEQRNVAEANALLCVRLRSRLAAWRDHVGRELARLRPQPAAGG